MNEEKKDFWCICSMMGHNQLAGFLSEFTMGGCSFLKLTIPETSRQPEWTRLFKDNSVYSIDPCTEEVARYRAEQINVAPMAVWDANDMLQKEITKQGKVILNKTDLPEGFMLPVVTEPTQPEPWEEDENPDDSQLIF